MIHYRDMTFCIAYGETCSNAVCARAMTEGEQFKANRWAEKSGLDSTPVAYSDFSDGCPDIFPASSLPNTVKVSR